MCRLKGCTLVIHPIKFSATLKFVEIGVGVVVPFERRPFRFVRSSREPNVACAGVRWSISLHDAK